MLTEIYCDSFGETKRIPFTKGLNIIQGISGNSIGKSSFLKIIDFAFGGRYYAESNADIVKHIGQHEICFCHSFGRTPHFFLRSTASPQKVLCCSDNTYRAVREISLEEFCSWLSQNYCLDDMKLSFRQIVGLYVRVWNKPNKEVNRPLYNHNSQPVTEAITTLIKLFKKYDTIQELHEYSEYLIKRSRVFKKAIDYHYLNAPKKEQVESIKAELQELSTKIDQLQRNISLASNENAENLSDEYNTLLDQRSMLILGKSRIKRALQRCKNNIEQLGVDRPSFIQMTDYFPKINMDRLKEVEGFHDSLRSVLLNELTAEEVELRNQLSEAQTSLEKINLSIQNLTGLPTRTSEALNSLRKFIHQQEQLQAQLDLYNENVADTQQRKSTKEKLDMSLKLITDEIGSLINEKIDDYSKSITTSNSKPPVLQLNPNQYNYGVEDNTGTGKAYTDLILFDLAILALTDLPILIHDSFLFNNIDDLTKQSFLKLYDQFGEKQIFISLDTFLGKDSEEIDKLLYRQTRLVLSESSTLYGKDWRI